MKNKLRPVVLVIMDGVGHGKGGSEDAVVRAHMANLEELLNSCPHAYIKAHGTAVGLPDDSDIGNSEVGHNALGCGQIYNQGAKLINDSIDSGRIWNDRGWREVVENCISKGSALHFISLLSDGNVHSNIAHLEAMVERACREGIKKVRIHALLDGRDVDPLSAPYYIERLEKHLDKLRSEGYDCFIASGGGRMKITMDRYEADWPMVERGWRVHVMGEGRQFSSAMEAVMTYRSEEEGIIDQNLPPFIIAKDGVPLGIMHRDDSVVLTNFRGDRAMEISTAFDSEDFDKFERGEDYPRCFAGMLEYDSDLKLPKRYLIEPPQIKNTLTELLVENGIAQYAVSETQKFGHVTYFWNGNRSGKISEELETFCEIPSDVCSFDEAPAMKSQQITDALVEALRSGKYGFLRCNFPNGDMVGHTGSVDATIAGLKAVDDSIGRIMQAVRECDAILVVTADHGNADDMLSHTARGDTPKTSHSKNPVPFVIWDGVSCYNLASGSFGLANVAPTVAQLLGLTPPAMWERSMLADWGSNADE